MPNLHKVVFAESIEVTANTARFIAENCPAHGQLGEAGAYYITSEIMDELKNSLAHDLDYAKNVSEIMGTLNEIQKVVDAEGLYEFYLEG